MFVFLSCTQIVNGQENELYDALDNFLISPSSEKLEKLESQRNTLTATEQNSILARVIVDCNLGFYKEQYNDLEGAILSYENAIRDYSKYDLTNYDIVSFASIPLGNLYTKTNALSEAERVIKGYIALSRKQKNKENLLAGLINLSITFQNQGKHQAALTLLQEAVLLDPKRLDNKINLATTLFNLNKISEAKELCTKILEEDSTQINAYKLFAQIAIKESETQRAVDFLKRAIETQKLQNTTSRSLAKTRLALSETYVLLRDFENAQEQLNILYKNLIPDHESDTLPSNDILFAENTLMDALDLQAYIYKENNQSILALEAYEKAALVSDYLNNPLLQESSRLILQTTDKIRSEHRILILYDLYHNSYENMWLEKALHISDRSKSKVLEEHIQIKKNVNAYKRDTLVQQYNRLQNRLIALETESLKLTYDTIFSVSKLENVQTQYAQAIIEKRELQRRIDKKFQAQQIQSNITGLEALTKITQENHETVVVYFFGKETIVQFRINNTKTDFIKIASTKAQRDSIFDACARFNSFFDKPSTIANNPLAYSQSAFDLYNKLQLPKDITLTVIPDDILSFIPLNALQVTPTTTLLFEEMPFLTYKTSLHYQTSLKNYCGKKTRSFRKPNVLGIFPVFENTDRALPSSITESETISQYFETTLILGKEATVSNAFAKASDYDILHFSTHASGGGFNRPAQLSFIDKSIYVHELNSFDIQPDLVVLSACETGVGKMASGEGILNLARGFYYAGAEHILFSLWKVNDKSTAIVMDNFYQQLKKTKSRNHSIRQAQLAYLKDRDIPNAKKSPYYWAPFVYYGASDVVATHDNWIWIIIAGIIGLILTFFLIRKYGITSRVFT